MSPRERQVIDAEVEVPPREPSPGAADPHGSPPDAAQQSLAGARPAAAAVPAGAQAGQPPAPRTRAGGTLARALDSGQVLLATFAWRTRRLGAAGMVGIALLAGAAVLYVANTLPQGKMVAALRAQLSGTAPGAGGGGVAAPRLALGGLPSRDQASDVLERIYNEAQAAGVDLPRGNYEYIAARDGVAAHYRMTFPVHTQYPALRDFMDRTLVALPSVAVEGLRIERKNVTDDSVDAELKLVAFVRDGN